MSTNLPIAFIATAATMLLSSNRVLSSPDRFVYNRDNGNERLISGSSPAVVSYHTTPRTLITTLTIIFGVFGAILLVALAVLFVHFFVVDLSDYILCCFRKQRHDRTNLSSNEALQSTSCFSFSRLLLRCRHDTAAMPRSANNRVYRPHLVAAASSPGIPACLNFRRRTDPSFLFGDDTAAVFTSTPNHRPNAGNRRPTSAVYSISPSSRLVSRSNAAMSPASNSRLGRNRRHSFLSSFYANSMFLPDDTASGVLVSSDPPNVIACQLPQPPSYDDAVGMSSFNGPRQQNEQRSTVADLALTLFSWSHLPPPPAYDEVITIVPPQPPRSPPSMPDLQPQQDQIVSIPPSTSISNCPSTAVAATTTPTVLSSSSNYAFRNQNYLANASNNGVSFNDYKPRSQRGCRLIVAGNSHQTSNTSRNVGASNQSAVIDDSSVPSTTYDVTHVYSWHI